MGGMLEPNSLVIADQGATERDTTRCEIVLGLLARKWMIPILVELAAAPRRRQYLFNRLKVSSSRLDPTIQELMRWGLIERAWIPNGRSDGPGIAISALGRSMLDLVTTLGEWQNAHLPQLSANDSDWRSTHPDDAV
jgi:DNA-binding HxlR family transcriptional regulator